MKITAKIVIVYLVLVLFAGGVTLIGYLELGKIGGEFDHALNQTLPVVEALREMNDHGRQLQFLAGRYVIRQLGESSEAGRARPGSLTAEVDEVCRELEATRDHHRALIEAYFPDELGLGDEIEERIEALATAARAVIAPAGRDQQTLLAGYMALEAAAGELRESTAEGLEEEGAELHEYQRTIDEIVWQHRLNVLLGAWLALLVGILAGAILARQIAGPIIRLNNAVRRFGQGDLQFRVRPEANDEIGELAGTFNVMAETLGGTMVTRDYVENIIESMSDGVVVLDQGGRIQRLNGTAGVLLDKVDAALIGSAATALFPEAEAFLTTCQRQGTGGSLEISLPGNEGTVRHLRIMANRLTELGLVTGLVLLVQDITSQKMSEERLRYMANYDTLTGLANRNMLAVCLRQSIARLPWSGRFAAVLFCDLDRFKFINDSLGHKIGDELLQRVAARLNALVRPGDMVFRLGGDEFVILVSEMAALYDIVHIADKIVHGITEPIHVGPHELLVTTSIGISIAPTDGSDADELLKNADLAMYEAKGTGKNQFCFFSEAMGVRTQARLRLENMLHHAITDGQELVVYYQPQVTIDGALLGFEALVRWVSPELGFISPADFLPAAEEAGWMGMLDNWVLRQACRDVGQWRREGGAHLRVAVNISDQMFKRGDFFTTVMQVLQESELEPSALELELTESVVMTDVEQAIGTMRALHDAGLALSIDDFGTGYSSFGQLKRCPIQTLKIDRSFVNDIVDDPNDAAIVEAIVAMAKRLGITSLAEGVETVEQLEVLRQAGCEVIQGYLFSRPVPAADVPAFLARFPRRPTVVA